MKMKSFQTLIPQVFRKPLVIILVLANFYVFTVIFFLSRWNPEITNVTAWLYDDQYVTEGSLRYYVDFRPGYPPLGKLPLYLIYLSSGGSALAILTYNVLTFNLSVVVFYYLVERLIGNRASILRPTVLYVLNPALIAAFQQPHADFQALAFALISLYFLLERKIVLLALSTAVGFTTKIYPVFVLLPAMIIAGNKDRIKLITTFVSIVWLISLPFLILDPFMYLSTYIHHLYRGPSESIFAILDGYYGHTGFIHPLFDAAIYYYQFSKVYQPSHDQHFYYHWRYPLLKYIALAIQMAGLIPLCLYIMRGWLKKSHVSYEVCFNLSILAFFTYLALSPMQNILVHLPAYAFACILLASSRSKLPLFALVFYALINGVHAISWSLLYQHIELALTIISNLRVLIVALIYLSTLDLLKGLRV